MTRTLENSARNISTVPSEEALSTTKTSDDRPQTSDVFCSLLSVVCCLTDCKQFRKRFRTFQLTMMMEMSIIGFTVFARPRNLPCCTTRGDRDYRGKFASHL